MYGANRTNGEKAEKTVQRTKDAKRKRGQVEYMFGAISQRSFQRM
jgi:hypothetical protein